MVSLLRGCYLESLVGAFLRSSFGAKQTLHFNPPCLRPSESAVCVSGSCDELTCVILIFVFVVFRYDKGFRNRLYQTWSQPIGVFQYHTNLTKKKIYLKSTRVYSVCVHKFCKTASFCEIVTVQVYFCH